MPPTTDAPALPGLHRIERRGQPAIDAAISALRASRGAWRERQDPLRRVDSFPARAALGRIVDLLAAALYPRRLGGFRGADRDEDAFVAAKLISAFAELEKEIGRELGYWQAEASAPFDADQPGTIVRLFATTLGEVRRRIDSDVEAAFHGDPAARSVDEVLLCYPGAIASLHHRIAHELYELGVPIIARIISELANERTGIDIHPGATIGDGLFIDHGTGVVIGETAIIGARVRLYQHVTLGAAARSIASPRERHARHPIVEDDAVIYAGATILGRVTIGARAVIGGNVWLLDDVPADAQVFQPEAAQLSHQDQPSPRLPIARGH
ncbi:serine O-acetyltransferase [Sphingomonas jinjuensis]|uniref:serine O-acetyltransferase n=1 Tax=Sphingomonas jinjuensis TaxID=535907 RepID=A0A840FDY6_9SPHN|nr:serine O-acetyltransferase [Sphingomonas jinjuensis]